MNPAAGEYVMVPSLFTTATPCLGVLVIERLDAFKVPPALPAASFAKTLIVVGVPDFTVAKSLLATGLSVFTKGSTTVISKGEIGHPIV